MMSFLGMSETPIESMILTGVADRYNCLVERTSILCEYRERD
ncbi:MAG TPA: hypothetical protein VLA12_18645 [Planctomycetaceae bacterium]|nr:hypothetical protein [Planctomycetaceae bacterium]